MRHIVAKVKNVRKLIDAVGGLTNREPTTPGIGLVYGATGFGKTTATKHVAVGINAVYVRALNVWTPRAMLATIMAELETEALGSSAAMVKWIAAELAAKQRALIVDEADYLVEKKALVETLRDLHDISSSPLLLVGMEDFKRKAVHRAQLAGRVSQWVEFKAADEDDVKILVDELTDLDIDAELLSQLHRETNGSIRSLVVGLSRIEAVAKKKGVDRMTAVEWSGRELTLFGGK